MGGLPSIDEQTFVEFSVVRYTWTAIAGYDLDFEETNLWGSFFARFPLVRPEDSKEKGLWKNMNLAPC